MPKILLTGGSGLLGRTLRAIPECDDYRIVAPTHEEMDVMYEHPVLWRVKYSKPDIILHAAAFTSPPKCETNKRRAAETNIVGTCHVARACTEAGIRLVYVSTDYVFDGEKGMYEEHDPVAPVNYYAYTKLMGEFSVRDVPDHLIIRTTFCADGPWPFPKAFVDHYTGREPVSVLAPEILAATKSSLQGTVHIAGPRKSLYDLARRLSPEVGKMSRDDVNFRVPKDTSLDTYRWEMHKKGVGR